MLLRVRVWEIQMDQESGFINSQPSMAEFMTALPHINESFQRASSITGGSGPTVMPVPGAAAVQHQQQQQLSQHNQHSQHNPTPALSSCSGGTVNIGDLGPHSVTVSSTSVESPKNVQSAEFAWMKEKKTTRKQQHHQGKSKSYFCLCFRWDTLSLVMYFSNQSLL